MPKPVLPEVYTFQRFRHSAILVDVNGNFQQGVSITHAVKSMIAGEKLDKRTVAIMGLLVQHLLTENDNLTVKKKSKK